MGLLWCSNGKQAACNGGDPGSTPGSGRAPGEGNGNPLQYSCRESHGWGAWQAMVHQVAESQRVRVTNIFTVSLTSDKSHNTIRGSPETHQLTITKFTDFLHTYEFTFPSSVFL